MNPNPKILLHCQYVYGIGHLVRALELARGLSTRFEVFLLNGGEAVPDFELPPSVNLIQLSAIYKKETDDFLTPVEPAQSLAECFHLREAVIAASVERIKPDILITEHFPFGLLFEKEAMGLISKVKQANPTSKIVSSVRDIIESGKGGERDDHTCDLINDYYDMVLVHGDERIAALSETFPKHNKINIPVIQTGYIVRAIPTANKTEDLPLILVSVAGGRLGNELLEVIIDCHMKIKAEQAHKLILFSGAFQKDFMLLEEKVSSLQSDDISIRKFNSSRYLKTLSDASLAISLGGYNSVIESVSANKPMLIYNREFTGGNEEQNLRIKLFEKTGHLEVIKPEDLVTDRLSNLIINKINRSYTPVCNINLNGVENSLRKLKDLFQAEAKEAVTGKCLR